MKRGFALIALLAVLVVAGLALAGCGSHHTHAGVCSYDSDDRGCSGSGPDNDGSR